MAHSIRVRGRLSDPRHIELDDPVNDLAGRVDVVIQEAEPAAATTPRSFVGLCADLGPALSAAEIDEARREMWARLSRDDVDGPLVAGATAMSEPALKSIWDNPEDAVYDDL